MHVLPLTRPELLLAAQRFFQAHTKEKNPDGRWLPKRYMGLERQAVKQIKHAFKRHMFFDEGFPYAIKDEPKDFMRLLLSVQRFGEQEFGEEVREALAELMAVVYQKYKDDVPSEQKTYDMSFPSCYEVSLFHKTMKEQDELDGGSTAYESDIIESLLEKCAALDKEATAKPASQP